MAEICINENDIKPLIESYKKVNNSFNLYSFSELKGNKMVCKFFIDKQECRIDIWIKKNSVKIMPAKNPDYANKLIEYITKKHKIQMCREHKWYLNLIKTCWIIY